MKSHHFSFDRRVAAFVASLAVAVLLAAGTYVQHAEAAVTIAHKPPHTTQIFMSRSGLYRTVTTNLGLNLLRVPTGFVENSVTTGILPIAGTFSKMYAYVDNAPGGSASWTVTLVDGTTLESVTCTITSAATRCNDLTNTFTAAAGDIITIKFVANSSPAGAALHATIQFSPTTANQTAWLSSGEGFLSTTREHYMVLSTFQTSGTDETVQTIIVPEGGTFQSMYAQINQTISSGNYIVTPRDFTTNATTSITCTITSQACNNTSNTYTTSSPAAGVIGDRMDLSALPAAPSNGRILGAGIGFTPTTAGNFDFANFFITDSATVQKFIPIVGGAGSLNGVEASSTMYADAMTISDMQVYLQTVPGGVATRSFAIRQNSATTTATCTITGSGNNCRWTGTLSVALGDRIGIVDMPSGSPTATQGNISIVATALPKSKAIINTTLTMPNNMLGLVGHWTFDGKDMISNVADTSGQGNTGYMVAAATSSQVTPGPLGQALKFNGTTQYVSIGSKAALQILTDVSFGGWYNFNSLVANSPILLYGVEGETQATNVPYYLVLDTTDAKDILYIHEDGAGNNSAQTFNTNLVVNKWYHIFVTRNVSTNVVSLYLNGSLFGTYNYTTDPDGGTSGVLDIGRSTPAVPDTFTNGKIDDVRIYNRALSAAEVRQLYNGGTATHQNTTLNPPNLTRGLVGHWTFDGKDMLRNVADSSGRGNNGNLVGFTSTTTVAGKLGQALNFNGTTNYISEPTSISNIQSVGFWAKTNSTTAQGLINLTGTTVFISTNASKVISGTGFTSPTYYIDGSAAATPTLNTGNWHYVVVEGTAAITGSQLEMGRANSVYFNGSIDDVRIYNRALSPADITQLYKLGH